MLLDADLLLLRSLGFGVGCFFLLLCGLPFALGRQGGNAVDGFLESFFVGSSLLVGLNQGKLVDGVLHPALRIGGLVFQIFHITQGT